MPEVSPYYKKQCNCPVCKARFETMAIRSSRTSLSSRESDFHPIYHGPSPLHYSISVCPLCNYATFAKNFNEELKPAKLEILSMALVLLADKRHDFTGLRSLDDVLTCFDLALNIARLRQDEADVLAQIYLYKAWIAREKGDENLEGECLAEALDQLQYMFNHFITSSSTFSDIQMVYLIGEIYLRLGYPDEAVQWFIKTVGHRDIKSSPQIEKLTRERWSDAREWSAEVARNAADNSGTAETGLQKSEQADSSNNQQNKKQFLPSGLFQRNRQTKITISIEPELWDWFNHFSNKPQTDNLLQEAVTCFLSLLKDMEAAEGMPANLFQTPDSLAQYLARNLELIPKK